MEGADYRGLNQVTLLSVMHMTSVGIVRDTYYGRYSESFKVGKAHAEPTEERCSIGRLSMVILSLHMIFYRHTRLTSLVIGTFDTDSV